MISLDDGASFVDMATTNTTEDLGDEVIRAFFGRKIREGKPGVGLDDANGGELREVEAFGDGLGADDDIDFARFDVGIERIKSFVFFGIAVETGDFCVFKEVFQLRFEEFCAETFVDDFWAFALWAGNWNFFFISAGVTDELIGVGVEC